MTLGNITGHNERDIANLFANFFEPLFSSGDITGFKESEIKQAIHFPLELTERDITESIRKLKSPNSIGPDGIPGIFIKTFSNQLSFPLFLLFNLIITQCQFPRLSKSSYLYTNL